ncbi:MAG: 23S rRNA (adenine(2503)-C(2))-methyltransferase RlmN [Proteobacteria bacterium]|nr:23S rRNA (adenine(2503)-C(2))-methyltransferase RlmN [Pseudomonadota bacterium]
MSDKKINLLGYSLESLEAFFNDIGEPKFRAKQLIKWVHQKGILDFSQMTDFNKILREKLELIACLRTPMVEKVYKSPEGTIKYLVKLESGSMIEMVRIPEKKRMTLCISSQAGCALQCTFCATGAQGFETNLTPDEIIGPLLNFEPVIESAKIMKEQLAYGLSRKRITISTSGITPQIDKLCNEIDVSLAISLHAPTNELRDEIVPINKKYPISNLINSCNNYLKNYDGKRSITIEYILIDGINDSEELARKLAKLLSNISCKINLIPFNPFEGSNYKRSKTKTIENFKKILMDKGFITTLRVTRGDAIDGACGQLVGKLNKSIKGKKLISHKLIS